MDNDNNGPVIPAGVSLGVGGKPAYDPLTAARNNGQPVSPDMGQSGGITPQPIQETPTGTSFAELAAKKGFASADDLARAYENLESQNKRVEMGLAELARAREEVHEQSPKTVETQEDAMKVVESVVKKVTRPLEDKIALQDLFFRKPDAMQYASDIAKVVKENPGITWETAYKAAKADALESKAREAGRQEAYQNIQQKEKLATGGGKPATRDSRPIDDLIKDKSIPFNEISRIVRERFAQ